MVVAKGNSGITGLRTWGAINDWTNFGPVAGLCSWLDAKPLKQRRSCVKTYRGRKRRYCCRVAADWERIMAENGRLGKTNFS